MDDFESIVDDIVYERKARIGNYKELTKQNMVDLDHLNDLEMLCYNRGNTECLNQFDLNRIQLRNYERETKHQHYRGEARCRAKLPKRFRDKGMDPVFRVFQREDLYTFEDFHRCYKPMLKDLFILEKEKQAAIRKMQNSIREALNS